MVHFNNSSLKHVTLELAVVFFDFIRKDYQCYNGIHVHQAMKTSRFITNHAYINKSLMALPLVITHIFLGGYYSYRNKHLQHTQCYCEAVICTCMCIY